MISACRDCGKDHSNYGSCSGGIAVIEGRALGCEWCAYAASGGEGDKRTSKCPSVSDAVVRQPTERGLRDLCAAHAQEVRLVRVASSAHHPAPRADR